MFYYKNISVTTKKFYGVTFKPGEVNSVPGYINDSNFIRVSAAEALELMKKNSVKTSKTTGNKVSQQNKQKSSQSDKDTAASKNLSNVSEDAKTSTTKQDAQGKGGASNG